MIADQSVNRNLIKALRRAGYLIKSIAEEFQGMKDEEIAIKSLSPPHIILSEDKDFGEMVYHYRVSVVGVIFLRYSPQEYDIIEERLLSFIQTHSNNLKGKFVVLTVNKIRIRTF